ncbi:MAG: tRNA (N6-isopentenyl adenosine(37)-C2)-methylthiotransferase MiaB [Peptoniphilus sp.]|uniref:tRNA (N6-isopentenyl adenosine(37)-C2)-methylthiotransferase MiaB n=1 Tax=Peptoniphilus sp. TaxID=1971214 RepID=UPI0025F352AF|nr:tRNA (N6-isopentenyl adenosine(37)-C2)-methylthiotransferase MiaB [Peptoniphilus sp.]MCI5642811.1 tRNA (N6-isopentenyl adenosine(37)-C2)-methylthiotransferase MiaB [Peptoniphilus sp.]MDD7352491.1 tRNA (N6-isopentenyl adenosine(37)-C2)-methylthiotransferase MiaB [Peptoniphilaceae bacterium]MDY3903132.1 tRNA (N6-isopentenyl adenosine(37)-C2)-methylthiotransferase MiaB [Peptoniphilus sp.]
MENKELINDINNNINEYIRNIKENVDEKKALVITHGCQMNEHDSEKITWLLEKMGYTFVNDVEDADLVILNTCSVRHSAEDKVYGQLGNLKNLKSKKKNIKVAVCGCMMQREESRNYVIEKFPNVDIIFGTNNIWKLPELLSSSYDGRKLSIDIEENPLSIDNSLGANRLYNFKSYVNIMYGCNNFCSYCIVPYTRGRETSRKPIEIIREIEELAKNGTKEVTLLGQNVNSYGKNFDDKFSFANLIEEINDIKGIERIRFMTSHPKDISDELIYSFKNLNKLCNFLHLPVQAGSSRVLKMMNRKYTKEDYLRKIDKVKNVNPNIALSTDIMVGFPGESEEDFLDTLDLVKKVEYDTSFTFIYSMRENTPAAKMEQVPDKVKHERFERLLEILYPIQEKKNKAFIGRDVDVLVEDFSKKDNTYVSGRTDEFKLINFNGNKNDIGKILKVRVKDANSFSLVGEKIES